MLPDHKAHKDLPGGHKERPVLQAQQARRDQMELMAPMVLLERQALQAQPVPAQLELLVLLALQEQRVQQVLQEPLVLPAQMVRQVLQEPLVQQVPRELPVQQVLRELLVQQVLRGQRGLPVLPEVLM